MSDCLSLHQMFFYELKILEQICKAQTFMTRYDKGIKRVAKIPRLMQVETNSRLGLCR
jgi:hypothetical protein